MSTSITMTNLARRFALASLLAASAAGCSGQVGVGNAAAEDGDSQENTAALFSADAAVVGQKARVTASALNLRTGPSTDHGVIAVMSNGAIVDVTAQSGGWYKVSWNGKVGWCSGTYLTPAGGGGGNTNNNTPVDNAMNRAASGVGFSYHWGGGCWDPKSTSHGACYGSCPNCSHSGTWGADCSGFVAKAWQVPGPIALTTCSHPYSTWNFRNTRDHWYPVPRSQARRGDAYVHNESGSGHIFLFESGDPWGNLRAYEARGCSYGIVHGTRTATSNYIVIRREGF